ncbi:hypothetical protein CYLTODRAFT_424704 [Cylindrobasidium torrendii FP15055 ss-10]|uniref:SnoaL-like domain-containing protein n=1 Tax=Cylindrobasidium torrendii FP15055 ss-10 TaxID=1314674 RepID=A0A0D7B663_9AGAR|nr:hypothetical protein CYLTODRAFT_424704 [Cylindrobasidium torrendii FP15055 ss-10]
MTPSTQPNLSQLEDPLYTTLRETAHAFINAKSLDEIKAVITHPEYAHGWGHNDYISKHSYMSSILDYDAFFVHLERTGAKLSSVGTEITDTVVDVRARKVVIRATYTICAKGILEDEAEVNDLVWIFKMTDDGTKIREGIEFVDGDWAGRLNAMVEKGRARLETEK